METIREYAIPPWEPRLQVTLEPDRKKATEMANRVTRIVIATSSSVKKGIVGMGGSTQNTLFNRASETGTLYAVALGTREEQNPYTAELAAIAMAPKTRRLPSSTGASPSSPGTCRRSQSSGNHGNSLAKTSYGKSTSRRSY